MRIKKCRLLGMLYVVHMFVLKPYFAAQRSDAIA